MVQDEEIMCNKIIQASQLILQRNIKVGATRNIHFEHGSFAVSSHWFCRSTFTRAFHPTKVGTGSCYESQPKPQWHRGYSKHGRDKKGSNGAVVVIMHGQRCSPCHGTRNINEGGVQFSW
jgi:hypothetical protein